jgi:hypothetical protein
MVCECLPILENQMLLLHLSLSITLLKLLA